MDWECLKYSMETGTDVCITYYFCNDNSRNYFTQNVADFYHNDFIKQMENVFTEDFIEQINNIQSETEIEEEDFLIQLIKN